MCIIKSVNPEKSKEGETSTETETCEGEEYLRKGTAQGAAESGTAACESEVNGLLRVLPKRKPKKEAQVGRNGNRARYPATHIMGMR